MSKQKGCTEEFENEAVRLALTIGRTRRELVENLGVGLSTLTRWIGRRRDREIDFSDKGRTEMACQANQPGGIIVSSRETLRASKVSLVQAGLQARWG
jgi:transposase